MNIRQVKNNKINPGERYIQGLWLLYSVDKDFRKDIEIVRKNAYISRRSLLSCQHEHDFREETRDDNEFGFSVEELDILRELNPIEPLVSKMRMKYNLSFAYQKYLEELVLDDVRYIRPNERLPKSLEPFVIQNPNNPKEEIAVISISPETSLKEVQTYWTEIKHFACLCLNYNDKEPKKYIYTQFNRDLEIFRLKKLGLTSIEIAKTINDKYPEVIGYQDVNIIISKLKAKARSITKRASQSSE